MAFWSIPALQNLFSAASPIAPFPFSPCAIAGLHPDKKRGYPRKGNLLNLYFDQSYTRRLLLLRRRLNILECLANLVAYAALYVALHRAYQAADSLCR